MNKLIFRLFHYLRLRNYAPIFAKHWHSDFWGDFIIFMRNNFIFGRDIYLKLSTVWLLIISLTLNTHGEITSGSSSHPRNRATGYYLSVYQYNNTWKLRKVQVLGTSTQLRSFLLLTSKFLYQSSWFIINEYKESIICYSLLYRSIFPYNHLHNY